MFRYVILEHDHPVLHWDLMLEAGDVLQTWRLAKPPKPGASPIEATALPDHRPMYLDYEGPVRGHLGTVRRWDCGVYEEGADSLPGRRVIFLRGERTLGGVCLEQVEGAIWRLLVDFDKRGNVALTSEPRRLSP